MENLGLTPHGLAVMKDADTRIELALPSSPKSKQMVTVDHGSQRWCHRRRLVEQLRQVRWGGPSSGRACLRVRIQPRLQPRNSPTHHRPLSQIHGMGRQRVARYGLVIEVAEVGPDAEASGWFFTFILGAVELIVGTPVREPVRVTDESGRRLLV